MTPHTTGFPASVRRAILERDPICRACGLAPSTEADHITPVAEGGTDHADNGQGLCASCHWAKSEQERRRGLARWEHSRAREQRAPEAHPGLIE